MRETMINRNDEPMQTPIRGKRRIPGLHEEAEALVASRVVRIELAEDENPRWLVEQLYQAANRRVR